MATQQVVEEVLFDAVALANRLKAEDEEPTLPAQRAAAVVVQKSLREGFGLVVTEAMWKGKPVVGGDVGGIFFPADGETVVYAADQHVDGSLEAFRVPIEGGAVTTLTGPMVAGGGLLGATVAGDVVLYTADQETDEVSSSTVASQSLSASSQTSGAPGFRAGAASSQSVPAVT